MGNFSEQLWGDSPERRQAPELADFITENKAWLRVYRLPAYAPDLNEVFSCAQQNGR